LTFDLESCFCIFMNQNIADNFKLTGRILLQFYMLMYLSYFRESL